MVHSSVVSSEVVVSSVVELSSFDVSEEELTTVSVVVVSFAADVVAVVRSVICVLAQPVSKIASVSVGISVLFIWSLQRFICVV